MLTPAERALERSRMSTALVTLGEFSAHWSPTFRRLICRSTIVRRRFALPPDALYVGTYSKPSRAAEILEDLEELLESRNQEARASAAAARHEAHDG